MDCSCSIKTDTDGDGPSLYSEKIVTARKEHKCIECNQVILIGEKYEKVDGCWDGSWSHFKTCEDCLSMIEIFFYSRPCFGDLWEEFYNEFSYLNTVVPEDCFSALTPGARAKVCKMIEDNWEE